MSVVRALVFVVGGVNAGTAFTYAYLVLPPLLNSLGLRLLEQS